MKHQRMSATQKRFILFYLLFASIFMFSYVPVYRYVHGVSYDNIREQSARTLEKGIVSLDANTRMVLNTYSASSGDQRFFPLRHMNGGTEYSPSELNALIRMLDSSLIPADLVYDAAIIRTNEPELIIAKNRSFFSETYYTFYPDFFSADNYSRGEWMSLLSFGTSSGKWLPEQIYRSPECPGGYRALTWVRVWSGGGSDSPTLFFATINSDQMVNRLAEAEVLRNGFVEISDQDGLILLRRGSAELRGCEVISAFSSVTGFTVRLGVPKNYLNRQMEPLKSMILLYILLLAAIALLMVLVFSYRSAAPMKMLLNSFQSSRTAPSAPQEFSGLISGKLRKDYAQLASGISRLSGQLKSSEEMILEQTDKLKDALFSRALTRSLYVSIDLQDFQRLFHDFPQPFWLAMVKLSMPQPPVDEAVQLITEVLQESRAQISDLYYAHLLPDGMLLVLPREEKEALDYLKKKLAGEQIEIRVSLTGAFHTADDLPIAYDQIQCMELMPAQSEVAVYGNLGSTVLSHVSMPLSYQALLKMYDALATGNEALAHIILNECADNLLMQPDQLMTVRHAYSMISHMLTHLKMEFPAALFNVVIPDFESRDLNQLFRRDLPDCFHRICTSLLESQKPADGLSVQVLEFINENLFSKEMCVTFAADHFTISKNALQKIVKDATGATFSLYISTMRMERAYRLLKELGLSVQQVSDMCGFSSPNSFYKAFRRKYGFAPSAISGGDEDDIGLSNGQGSGEPQG